MQSVAADTRDAAGELTQASEYQRKAGRRAACLMIVLIFVVAIVLLAVCLPPARTRTLTDPRRDADSELDAFLRTDDLFVIIHDPLDELYIFYNIM